MEQGNYLTKINEVMVIKTDAQATENITWTFARNLELGKELNKLQEEHVKLKTEIIELKERNERSVERNQIISTYIKKCKNYTEEIAAIKANINVMGFRLDDIQDIETNKLQIKVGIWNCYAKFICGQSYDIVDIFPRPSNFDSLKKHLQLTQDFTGFLAFLLSYFTIRKKIEDHIHSKIN